MTLTMLAQLLLSLSILVAVHEMGHLLAAKYFGMRVEQFSIGFPPKIWSFKKGETEYAISAIPLGGYVKISGMIDESLDTEQMKQPPQPWEFRSKPAWQRLIVMLGGIFVNVVFGVIIFIGLTFVVGDTFLLKDVVNENGGVQVGSIGQGIGLKTGDKIVKINGNDFRYLEDIVKPETLLSTDGYYTVDRDGQMIDLKIPVDFIQNFSKKEGTANFIFYRFTPEIGIIDPGSFADKNGIKVGDKVTEINGTPIRYFDEITKAVTAIRADSVTHNSDTITVKILRAGEPVTVHQYFRGQKQVGIGPGREEALLAKAEERITYGFFESIPKGTVRAFTTLGVQVKAFGRVITGALSPKKSISGPIGIMRAFGPDWDWTRFWSLTGVLSLVLAFMNLLPIPALDGGHVMFLTYEIVSRRKPSDKFLENAQKVGLVLLLTLMVFIFANDIMNLFH